MGEGATEMTYVALICAELREKAWGWLQEVSLDFPVNLIDLVTIQDSDFQQRVLERFLASHPSANEMVDFMIRAPQYADQVFDLGAASREYEWSHLVQIAANLPGLKERVSDYAKSVFKRKMADSEIEAQRCIPVLPLSEADAGIVWHRVCSMQDEDDIDRFSYTHEREYADLADLFLRSTAYRRPAAKKIAAMLQRERIDETSVHLLELSDVLNFIDLRTAIHHTDHASAARRTAWQIAKELGYYDDSR